MPLDNVLYDDPESEVAVWSADDTQRSFETGIDQYN